MFFDLVRFQAQHVSVADVSPEIGVFNSPLESFFPVFQNNLPGLIVQQHSSGFVGKVFRLDHLLIDQRENKAIHQNWFENLRNIQVQAESPEVRFVKESDSGVEMRSVNL